MIDDALAVLLVVGCGSMPVASAQEAGALRPTRRLDLSISDGTGREVARTSLSLELHAAHWRPDVLLPFARIDQVQFEHDPQRDPPAAPEVRVQFLVEGEEDPGRRVAVFLTARDAEGRALHETWRLCEDQRIWARKENECPGRGRFLVSPTNLVRFELPGELATPSSIELRFDDLSTAEWYHFPLEPSPLGLKMTRPSVEGEFELAFGYPSGPAWRCDELACVVVVYERDSAGTVLAREVRSLDRPGADGRFRTRFRLPPERIDSSSAELVFFTRQPDNERFVDAHFRGLGQLGFGGGQWSQSRYALIHVTFER